MKLTSCILRGLLICAAAATLFAQQDMTAEWQQSLLQLDQKLSAVKQDSDSSVPGMRAEMESLREALSGYAHAHSNVVLHLPDRLPDQAGVQALRDQWNQLRTAVNDVVRVTPGSPFNLGRITVEVTDSVNNPSPVVASIDQSQIRELNLTNAAKALDYLPGVTIQHIASNRNEAGIMVRGFSTRGQVPLYIDGIPISVPYDGFVDFNRYLTSDIAEVQVSKGYSSPLLGPNALGGSINLVTQEPTRKFNADALIGTGSGDTLLSSLRLGTRWNKFFFQGETDWLQQRFTPLPGDFVVRQYAAIPQFHMTDHLNNSWSRDEKFSGRMGWTPKAGDEYVFSYVSQKGQKGVPLYQGPNTSAAFRNFWAWPYWDVVNYYFHSNTQIGTSSSLKFRAFYDQFLNDIDMYSDATYRNMNTTGAAHSMYDEHNDGVSLEYNTRAVKRNSLSGSFFFKDDTHRERSNYPARSPFPLLTPDLVDRDQQASIGGQDVIAVTEKLRVTLGFSADHFKGLQGQAYNATSTGLLPFTCVASPNNTSFAGCTAHVWNYNPQAAVSYNLGQGNLFLTFADRGRFPMLKDIYSAGLGSGLPNPDLRPEKARSWNLGYSHSLGSKTSAQIVLYRAAVRSAIESVFVTDPKGNTVATAFCPNSRVLGFCSEMANIGNELHKGVEVELRSNPISRLTLHASYSYLNRSLQYDFTSLANVSAVNTAITILPSLAKNKFVGTASYRTWRQIVGTVNLRYEGGITLQDTTYAATSPLFLPHGSVYATTDLALNVPVWKGATLQGGVKNVFDRLYYYTAGYPEAGRNWFANLRYTF